MKKLILLIGLCLLICGCDAPPITSSINGINIVEIDGCEYIRNISYSTHIVYTHKGNCKYCIERNKK